MCIVNLTQHPATPEQVAAGVRDVPEAWRARLRDLLTFDTPPDAAEILSRARQIANLADEVAACGHLGEVSAAMIGGAAYLMPALDVALRGVILLPLHAFTRREVVEHVAADGTVEKTAVFRHAGFVEAPDIAALVALDETFPG